jgi:RNA polymerase sigma-B factor
VTTSGATPPEGSTSAHDGVLDPEAQTAAQRHAAEIDDMLRRLAALPPDDPERPALRQHLVEAQLPLVHHLAQRFRGRGEPYDDLVQVGTIGLLNAVDRFDPERGSFTGFAVPTILGEIRRHFRDRGWAMRVPRRLQELGRQVSEAREILTQKLGRSPTVQEIAQHLDADTDLVLEALDTASVYATVPLPSTPEEGEMAPLGFIDTGLELVEQRATLRPLLARLPARERTILALRFVRGMSQSQIAAEVGVSQMHVSRLITRSLAVLREGLNEEV